MKYLQYNFTKEELKALKACKIINGCGGKGGFDFDILMENAFKTIPKFKESKFDELWEDFQSICVEHDFDYRIKVGFHKANYRMGLKTYKLIKKWAGKKEALLLGVSIFFVLKTYSRPYYFTK